MRLLTYSLLVLASCLAACESASTVASSPAQTGQPAQAAGNETAEAAAGSDVRRPSQPAANQPVAAQPTPRQGQYRLLGILDPSLNNMVAFALKVPRDWQVKQSFERQWKGNMPSNKVYLSFRSPDGSQQIEYLPALEYGYSDGPTAQSLRANAQAMGINQLSDNELAPMPALTYLREYLLPQLAQKGLALRSMSNEREALAKQGADQQIKSSASVDGVLSNGHKARIECRLSLSTIKLGEDISYGWVAVPSITQTSGDLAATYEKTRVAQESIIRNPEWVRQQNEMTNSAIQANTEASRLGHEGRMADIRRQGEANTAAYNERMANMDRQQDAFNNRMASQDRQHEAFVDRINEQTKYADPNTGQRVKASDQYKHVYTDNQGNYYGSTTPIAAERVNWQELQQVALKDY
jgi:hypothetical protein